MTDVRCFKCEKPITSSIPDGTPHQGARDATYWSSQGNYGSTVWDMLRPDEPSLELYICDGCLTTHADRVFTVVGNGRDAEYVRGIHHELGLVQPRPCEECGEPTTGYMDGTGCCMKIVWKCIHHLLDEPVVDSEPADGPTGLPS